MVRGAGMLWAAIEKNMEVIRKTANLADYQAVRASFSWEDIRRELPELSEGGGFNIAYAAVDCHAEGDRKNHPALQWLGSGNIVRSITYGELKSLSNRMAAILANLGTARGDTVCTLVGRIPELYIAALGVLKNTSVFCPLFPDFGPEPIYQRLNKGNARILITTRKLYREKVARIMDRLPSLRYVLLVDIEEHDDSRLLSLPRFMTRGPDTFTIAPTDYEDMALMHFTSGTTGMPNGAVHTHGAALVHYMTGKYVLDFHPDDIFWCTADPGWMAGTAYSILAPLLHGITTIVDEANLDAVRCCEILESQKVSVWYTAPTIIRKLVRSGVEPARSHDLQWLRLVFSVGESLGPEEVVWGQKVLGLPIHDTWWQTETGGIMIANYPAMDIRPGSMGKPLPGIEAAIVEQLNQNEVRIIDTPDTLGELAFRPGWPSMFRGYLNDGNRYQKCFAGDWYLTGDMARRDADGYFWFTGRTHDAIKTSGCKVGPFEVEKVLVEHPAVAEAGVIGKPDSLLGELVKAFVIVQPGYVASDELRRELIGFAEKQLGSVVAPKEIEFTSNLPKNKSGNLLRRLLKAKELGLTKDGRSGKKEG